MYYYRCGCDYIGAHLVFYVFFFNDTATTEIYTYDTLFPYTTLFRSPVGWTALQRASAGSDRPGAMHGACGATARDCRCATGGRRPDRTSAQPWTGRGMRRHDLRGRGKLRSEEHTSELQSLMRISYAVFCLKKKTTKKIKRD